MKILITNLDVGSGIEYVGDKIIQWVKEKYYDVNIYKYQTCVNHLTEELIRYSPDLIIVNEYFPRVIEPIFYYKKFNPQVKVLFVSHSWKTLLEAEENEHNHLVQRMLYLFITETCDKIICLSKKHSFWEKFYPAVSDKTVFLYMPVSSDEYRIITPWSQRPNLFGQFGNTGEIRMSQEFIEKVQKTNLHIDCYTSHKSERVQGISNFTVYPRVPQNEMPEVLNRYKCFVMPHDGPEVFFIAMLQAILCGTIPLVTNNRKTNSYNYTWIDWAEGLYLGTYDTDSFIQNLQLAEKDTTTNFEQISNDISRRAKALFDEKEIKKEVLNFITKCGII